MNEIQLPIQLSLEKSVLAVELFDLIADKRVVTFHRPGSRCTFTKEISHGSFRITLRLDWGDLNDGEPTLDMDVERIQEAGALRKIRPKSNPSHRTRLSDLVPGSINPRFYDIKYEGLTLRLVARKTFAASVSLSAFIVDPVVPPWPCGLSSNTTQVIDL